MRPILSILIPSILAHREQRISLVDVLLRQKLDFNQKHPSLGQVEIRWNEAKSFLDGGLSIGKNREALVNEAIGKYLCFIDSDDLPSPQYVETLVRLCHEHKDVVTFRSFTTTDHYWTVVDMSLEHSEDEDAGPGRIVKRRPWPVCPVLSRYAKEFPFPDINDGEDAQWMKQVLTLCKSEAHTDMILHQYKHSSKTSESMKIIKAGYV